jgi:hypothetical protein
MTNHSIYNKNLNCPIRILVASHLSAYPIRCHELLNLVQIILWLTAAWCCCSQNEAIFHFFITGNSLWKLVWNAKSGSFCLNTPWFIGGLTKKIANRKNASWHLISSLLHWRMGQAVRCIYLESVLSEKSLKIRSLSTMIWNEFQEEIGDSSPISLWNSFATKLDVCLLKSCNVILWKWVACIDLDEHFLWLDCMFS